MRPNRKALLLLLLLPAIVSSGLAEESLSVDEQFEEARKLAFSGQRDEARALCERILEEHPGYVDVRILMGRTWAWDGENDKARAELTRALADDPDYSDARNAAMDNELWSGDYEEVIRLADEGLRIDPGNPDFLYRKGRALRKLDRDEEALLAAKAAWKAEPGNRDYRTAYRRLLDSVLPNKFTAAYRYESFNDIDAWHDGVLQYRRRFEWGSLLGRLNFARRYDTNGRQIEVDAYPRVAEHTYLYLNFGYSNTSLFPEIRYAAEVYHNFPHGWEGSLGFRRLEFDSTSVMIYTGTVAKYVGNWWISLRPNYVRKGSKLEADVPDLDLDTSSYSAGITARRYLGSRYEYVGMFVSAGSGDQLVGVPVGGPIDSDERITADGFRLGGEIRKRVANTVILRGALGYRSNEMTFDRVRKSWYLVFGVEKYW